VYAALALWSMPKLIMASSPFTRSGYMSSYGYECPAQRFSPRYKVSYQYGNEVSLPYQWCLKRPVISGSSNMRSLTCDKQITRSGSIMSVDYAGRRSSSSRFQIRTSSGRQKYSSSKLPECHRVSSGDTIRWTDTAQSYQLSLYACFSNTSCPVTATVQTTSHSDFWGSGWFYPLIGVAVVMAVGCSIYRRARLRQMHANRRRRLELAANAGANVVTTTTTINNAAPVCVVATAAPVAVAQPGGSMPAAYPVAVATATAQPMPQAVVQPAMAQAVAHPVGVGTTPVAVATATAVPMKQVLL